MLGLQLIHYTTVSTPRCEINFLIGPQSLLFLEIGWTNDLDNIQIESVCNSIIDEKTRKSYSLAHWTSWVCLL